MTERVNPTIDDTTSVQQTAAAIRYAGGSSGWIVPSGEDPGLVAREEPDIDETALNAFDATWSDSSLEVTIDGGQAYLGGCWLARDTPTTITLDANAETDIYLSVDMPDGAGGDANSNNLTIGPALTHGQDPWMGLWKFQTDDTGVTDVNDRRNVDEYRISRADIEGDLDKETHDVRTYVTGVTHSVTLGFIPNFDDVPVVNITCQRTDDGSGDPCVASLGYVGWDQMSAQAFKLNGDPVQTRMYISIIEPKAEDLNP